MKHTLRGHHLLCVHGFQGMGYSPSFVQKMKEIVADIQNENIDFPIQVTAHLDDACGSCPFNGKTSCQANSKANDHVVSMDKRILNHLELIENETYHKNELIERIIYKVEPDDLDVLCKNCAWLKYGVCKAGIAKLKERR